MSKSVKINSNLNKKDNKKLFSIPLGSKVKIIDINVEKIKIENENGLRGWIKKSDCKIL